MSVTEKLAELRTELMAHVGTETDGDVLDIGLALIAAVEALRALHIGRFINQPHRERAAEQVDALITDAAPMLGDPAQSPPDGERGAIIPQ